VPRIFESIGRGIVGAGRAIRGGAQGGAQQVTPPPPEDDLGNRPNETKRPTFFQKFGARVKRDATNAPVARGLRAMRARATTRRVERHAARGGTR
jgi:hypothetical protein